MRILLIEDDELIVTPLAKALMAQHYAVDVAKDGQAGWELAQAFDYDLILLDIGLPKLDGISLCRRLRSQGYQMPILLLTAQDTSTSKVLGLDAGADDYLTKPFDLQELLARIRARLRRGGTVLPPVLEWRGLQLNPSTCEVTFKQRPLHLTPKEYELLELFLHNPQRIFSCSALIDHLWSFEEPPGEDTVRSHIKGLRQKLKMVGLLDDPIENVYGIGYRLRTPIQPQTSQEEPVRSPLTSASLSFGTPENKDSHWAVDLAGMADIWEYAQPILEQRLAVVEKAAAAHDKGRLTAELRQQGVQEAHKLVGSLGMFGSDSGSDLARKIELRLQTDSKSNQNQALQLSALATALRQQVHTLQVAFSSQSHSSPVSEQPLQPLPMAATKTAAKIMVVDDDLHVLAALEHLLVPWGFDVLAIADPRDCLKKLELQSPDLLILDVQLPHITGIELCQMIRNTSHWSTLPILFLTAHSDATTVHQVFAAGADDFVSKPIMGPELINRILNRLERTRLLRNLAEVDVVTGVLNRRRSIQELTRLLNGCEDQQQTLCLGVVHLNCLKQINHQYGHSAGDQVLAHLGQLLRQTFQSTDQVGRWGGAEFVVAIAGISRQEGKERLHRLLQRFHQLNFSATSGTFQATVSLGTAQYPQDGQDLQSLYQAAITDLAPIQVVAKETRGSRKSSVHV